MQFLYFRDSRKCFIFSFISYHKISVVPGQALCLVVYYYLRDKKATVVQAVLTLEISVLNSSVTFTLQSIPKLAEAYMRIEVTSLLSHTKLMAKTISPNVPQAVKSNWTHSSHSRALKEAFSLLLLPLKFTLGLHKSDLGQEFIVQGHV